jgi:hypothetical protein
MRDTERLDLPSASSFEISVECEGQPALVATLPPQKEEEEEPDELALRGTRIHLALETGDTSELSDDEAEDYRKMKESEVLIRTRWFLERGFDADVLLLPSVKTGKEDRFWMNDPETGQPALSGKLDKYIIVLDEALVIDWKSGAFNKRLTPTQRNFQLRVQAVLLWREFDHIKRVRVAFAKPNSSTDFTDYSEADLEYSEAQIRHVIWRTQQPGAIRRPGQHCNWCPCKSFCPEAGAYTLLPSALVGNVLEMVDRLSPADLVAIWERSLVIGKILDAVKTRLKGFSDEQLSLLGLGRTPGRRLDPIIKTKEAVDFFLSEGINQEELWSALKLSKTELQKAIMRDQGWPADKTRGYLKQMLVPFIEEKQAAAGLEKITAREVSISQRYTIDDV